MSTCASCGEEIPQGKESRQTCSRTCASILRGRRKRETELLIQKGRSREGVIVTRSGREILVDPEDMDVALSLVWHVSSPSPSSREYAVCRVNGRQVFLHNILMKPPPDMTVDHVNRIGADNRRKNMRLATESQQCANRTPKRGSSSKFRGVSLHSKGKKWQVILQVDGKLKRFGLYHDEVEAARVADREAKKIYGEFAYLNFPEL